MDSGEEGGRLVILRTIWPAVGSIGTKRGGTEKRIVAREAASSKKQKKH
jgi:hypothetical protein